MASQSGEFNVQQFNDLGDPLIGGRLYTYAYGTTTQKTAYTDPAAAVPHTYTSDGLGGQYIALNARGELPAPLYLGNGPYDLTLKTAAGATIWTRRAQGTLIASNIIPVQLASAATVDIGGQGVTSIEITGNTDISSFGTNYAGPIFVRFLGSLTLVHNSVTLNLPGGTNSTVNPGDIVIASGNSNNNGWNVLVVSQNSFAKTGVNSDITSLTALVGAGLVPVGGMIDYPINAVPSGYLIVPTAATNISRTTYSALFAVLGTTWGAGDGSTTFGMPWIPADYATVQANGNVGTTTTGTVKAHTHGQTSTASGGGGNMTAKIVGAVGSETGDNNNTLSTGGPANLAAGVRMVKCIKF